MPSNIVQFDPYKVQNITVLKRPDAAKAQQLMEQVAQQVQPILRRRKWKVPQLTEFTRKGLLGMNTGGGGGDTQLINLRLRESDYSTEMLPYSCILGTMLHELAHNIRGPHDTIFYKLLDELKEECQGLMDCGISGTGAGFDANSVGRLGGRGPVAVHNPDPRNLRQVALQAAEDRARKQSVMFSGPRVIGGSTAFRNLTPAQAAARAAERRAADEIWCASAGGPAAEAIRASTAAPANSVPATSAQSAPTRGLQVSSAAQPGRSRAGSVHANGRAPLPGDNSSGCGCCIDLTGEDSDGSDIEMLTPDDMAVTGTLRDDVAQPSVRLRDPYAGSASSSVARGARSWNGESANALQGDHRAASYWQCGVCTLQNGATAVECAACGTPAYESAPSAPGRFTAEVPAGPDRPGVPATSGCPGALASSAAAPPAGHHQQHRQPAGHHQQRVSQWTCSFCTLSNVGHSEHCTACDTWRFSRKPAAL